MNIQH